MAGEGVYALESSLVVGLLSGYLLDGIPINALQLNGSVVHVEDDRVGDTLYCLIQGHHPFAVAAAYQVCERVSRFEHGLVLCRTISGLGPVAACHLREGDVRFCGAACEDGEACISVPETLGAGECHIAFVYAVALMWQGHSLVVFPIMQFALVVEHGAHHIDILCPVVCDRFDGYGGFVGIQCHLELSSHHLIILSSVQHQVKGGVCGCHETCLCIGCLVGLVHQRKVHASACRCVGLLGAVLHPYDASPSTILLSCERVVGETSTIGEVVSFAVHQVALYIESTVEVGSVECLFVELLTLFVGEVSREDVSVNLVASRIEMLCLFGISFYHVCGLLIDIILQLGELAIEGFAGDDGIDFSIGLLYQSDLLFQVGACLGLLDECIGLRNVLQ